MKTVSERAQKSEPTFARIGVLPRIRAKNSSLGTKGLLGSQKISQGLKGHTVAHLKYRDTKGPKLSVEGPR